MLHNHNNKVVLIFKSQLLPISETFIFNQAMALKHYDPYFVGISSVFNGISLPYKRHIILQHGLRLRTLLQPSHKDIIDLKAYKPSLIHAHFGTEAIYALPLAKSLDIPLLVTLHGYDVTVKDTFFIKGDMGYFLPRLYPQRRHKLFKSNANFIAISKFILHESISLGCSVERIRLHYIGVDNDFFQYSKVSLADRGQNILFVGRLVEKKGCQYLLDAMKIVQMKLPDAALTIIGDGPLRSVLESYAQYLKVNCVFLGSKDKLCIKDYLSKSRVFCVPSIIAENGDAEGFGIVFLESQATGLPVVSFSTGGIEEAVIHEKTGLLATAGNVVQLADYLISLLLDDVLWHQMSFNGFQHVQTSFSLVDQTRLLEQYYDELVNT
jgi:colanic acid/amylovoran biosynthesis glycosyltransferase